MYVPVVCETLKGHLQIDTPSFSFLQQLDIRERLDLLDIRDLLGITQ